MREKNGRDDKAMARHVQGSLQLLVKNTDIMKIKNLKTFQEERIEET